MLVSIFILVLIPPRGWFTCSQLNQGRNLKPNLKPNPNPKLIDIGT
jgi:hypothetical protein